MRNCSQASAAAEGADKAAKAARWTRLVLNKGRPDKIPFTIMPNTAKNDEQEPDSRLPAKSLYSAAGFV
jgi:hypothetical protein